MQKGTIKFFDWRKGYGFVRPEGGGDDEYINLSSFDQKLTIGEFLEMTVRTAPAASREVLYDIETGEDGREHVTSVRPA